MKNFKRKVTLFAALTSTVMGCAFQSEIVQPVAPNTNHSFAYNIANQTALLRDSSPLRDFTQEEVNQERAKVTERHNGDTGVILGAAMMATGSLINIISVAGGLLTNISEHKHEAANSRWIIAVPAEQFSSAAEAQTYITTSISKAAKKAYAHFGTVYEAKADKGRLIETRVKNDTFDTTIGLVKVAGYQSRNLVSKTMFPFDGKLKEAYVYGINRDSRFLRNLLVSVPETAGLIRAKQNPDYVEFYKSLTSELPYGFFLYSPSYPREKIGSTIYTYKSEVVPAIYSQGHKYEFIQPALAK